MSIEEETRFQVASVVRPAVEPIKLHPTVGNKVRVDYKRKGRLYTGTVTSFHDPTPLYPGTGSYTVEYDEGEIEDHVLAEDMLVLDGQTPDWHDDFHILRQFSAAFILRQMVRGPIHLLTLGLTLRDDRGIVLHRLLT